MAAQTGTHILCTKYAVRQMAARASVFPHMASVMVNTPVSGDELRFTHGGSVLPSGRYERNLQDELDAVRYAMESMRHIPALTVCIPEIIKKGEKEMLESNDSVEHRNWEYEIAHPDMLCPEEIHKYVTRTNPIVIAKTGIKDITYLVQVKGGKPEVRDTKPVGDVNYKEQVRVEYDKIQIVFVHASLVHKAEILGIRVPDWAQATPDQAALGGTTSDSIEVITAWAREVKSAKWGNYADRKSVRVIIPKV